MSSLQKTLSDIRQLSFAEMDMVGGAAYTAFEITTQTMDYVVIMDDTGPSFVWMPVDAQTSVIPDWI